MSFLIKNNKIICDLCQEELGEIREGLIICQNNHNPVIALVSEGKIQKQNKLF